MATAASALRASFPGVVVCLRSGNKSFRPQIGVKVGFPSYGHVRRIVSESIQTRSRNPGCESAVRSWKRNLLA
jgi:hypothetical protein